MSRVTLNQMYSYKLYTFFLLAMTPPPPPLQKLFSMAKLKINDIQYRYSTPCERQWVKPVCQCALFFVDFG